MLTVQIPESRVCVALAKSSSSFSFRFLISNILTKQLYKFVTQSSIREKESNGGRIFYGDYMIVYESIGRPCYKLNARVMCGH